MTWQGRFDRLLKAMSQGEPHKAEKRAIAAQAPAEVEYREAHPPSSDDQQSEEK